MPISFGSNFAREPFQFDSVGNDWEQESVTRPEGYPLYHYLQTKEGVGEVTVYSRNQAVSDNILSNSHTIELQKGQGILIAPNVPHSRCVEETGAIPYYRWENRGLNQMRVGMHTL